MYNYKHNNFRKIIVDLLPISVKKVIKKLLYLPARVKLFFHKFYMAHFLPYKHKKILEKNKGCMPIRVDFIASNFASWKVDRLVEEMNASELFEIRILLARMGNKFSDEFAEHERKKLVFHFKSKGFYFLDTYYFDNSKIKKIMKKFDPHVIFITNPHSLINPFLHEKLIKKSLSCYVPYHHEVVSYGNNREQYDQVSHNAFWKIFAPHQISKEYYKKLRMKKDKGVVVVGLPACEPLFDDSLCFKYPWKSKTHKKLRIIWAPHWLVRSDLKLATIYELGDAIKDLAWRYRDQVEWVMRPHPFLKSTLINHPDWGSKKTEDFFKFWAESEFTQIEEGDYMDLFHTSDAMIHDSGSFLAEYLCVNKPVMYLKIAANEDNYLNDFGKSALNACDIGHDIDDIEIFIKSLMDKKDPNAEKRNVFFNESLMPLYQTPPSKKICQYLINEFYPY